MLSLAQDFDAESDVFQLIFSLKMVMVPLGEPSIVYFSLYQALPIPQFLTDEFSVRLGQHGMPEDVDAINLQKTIFRDLVTAKVRA